MNINVLCVGNLKEKYFVDACAEYSKRISKFHNINIIEVKEGKLPKNPTDAEIEKVKDFESDLLEKQFKGYVILLDLKGENLTSEEFSKKIEKISHINSTITFVIGGSYGVNEKLKSKADYKLSYSKQTFPHQLMRVVLLESIYRSATISNNITYHK